MIFMEEKSYNAEQIQVLGGLDAVRKRPVKSEVDRLVADNSKAKKLLKWSPGYDLEEGLKKTLEWYKETIL